MTEKYGFVYVWYDRQRKRYYVGSHWGNENDRYVCSSTWMKHVYKKNPMLFKRRVVKRIYTSRADLLVEEQRWLDMIKDHELATFNTTLEQRQTVRYYNFTKSVKDPWHTYEIKRLEVGQKISASKTGKNTGKRDPSVGAKISAAKRGKALTEEHKQALRNAKAGRSYPHTEEWKRANGERMKRLWVERRASRETI